MGDGDGAYQYRQHSPTGRHSGPAEQPVNHCVSREVMSPTTTSILRHESGHGRSDSPARPEKRPLGRRNVIRRCCLAVLVVVGCSGPDEQVDTAWDPRPEAYRPPPSIVAQPAIIEPGVLRAAEAGPEVVQPDDLVIGIEIEGEARAYPLNHMDHMRRTVINDVVADQPVAVTLSRNALCVQVFITGTSADDAMTLQTANRAWQGSELLIDAQSETHWCQILGVGLYGPGKGEHLPRLPYVLVDWATWSKSHPNTLVTNMSPMIHRFQRLYTTQTAGRFTVGLVEPGAPVRAWRLDQLLYQPIHQETWNQRPILVCYQDHSGAVTVFDRTLDGQVLDFQWRDGALIDRQTGSRWDPLTGRAKDGSMVDRQMKPMAITCLRDFFWQKYFPDSDYWACPLTLFFGGQCAESAVWEATRGTPCRSALAVNAVRSLLPDDGSEQQATTSAVSESESGAITGGTTRPNNQSEQVSKPDQP